MEAVVDRTWARWLIDTWDIADGVDARDAFREDNTHYDLVLHCAAVVGGRQTIDGSPLSLAVDLSIDAELFGWAIRTRPNKVVYLSSSAAYPVDLQQRGTAVSLRENAIDLDDVRSPDALYGWSKLTGEILARHARNAGIDVLVVRPFSGWGVDQSRDYPFPSFLDRALRRDSVFDVWGDGSQTRDWIHISDVCEAILTAVDNNIVGPVNLGTGIGTSFEELARMFCDAAGYSPAISFQPDKPTGVHTRVADVVLLHSFYTPKISIQRVIEQALREASCK